MPSSASLEVQLKCPMGSSGSEPALMFILTIYCGEGELGWEIISPFD